MPYKEGHRWKEAASSESWNAPETMRKTRVGIRLPLGTHGASLRGVASQGVASRMTHQWGMKQVERQTRSSLGRCASFPTPHHLEHRRNSRGTRAHIQSQLSSVCKLPYAPSSRGTRSSHCVGIGLPLGTHGASLRGVASQGVASRMTHQC